MPNHLETFHRTISASNYITSGGTYAKVPNTGIPYQSKSAAADTTTVTIPIPVEAQDGEYGVQLTKIEVPVRVATANLVSTPTAVLYRRDNLAVAAAGTNMTASTVTTSKTGLTLTAAATDRKVTVTVSTPALDTTHNYSYNLTLTFHAATTSAVRVYDAIAYYTVPV